MAKLSDTPWLHIMSQFREHGAAYITGTREGLLELRGAIDAALNTEMNTAGDEVYASACSTDGEGYHVIIRLSTTLKGLGKPVYFETVAREAYHDECRLNEQLIKDRRKRALRARAAMEAGE